MILVASSSLLVPTASTIHGLIFPHLGLGLGIGVIDAALVPQLATLVDSKFSANYAVVYALQQFAVSLAYALGPLLGGELVYLIGFPGLMSCVGLINILYCPLLSFLNTEKPKEEVPVDPSSQVINYSATQKYKRFNNDEDSD